MAIRITHGLNRETLVAKLPNRYKPLAPFTSVPERLYTLLLFQSDREAVIVSRLVESAIAKLPAQLGETLVAVGGAFTVEAVELLQQRG